MVDFLMEAVDCYCDSCGIDRPEEMLDFAETDLLTNDKGFIIRIEDNEFRIVVTRRIRE